MDTVNLKKVKFQEKTMTLYYPLTSGEGFKELSIKYVKDGKLRDKAIELVTAFTKEFPYSFSSHCTRCGNCCSLEEIKVNGSELFNLGRIFNLNEKEFYNKYLKPCPSISDYDGYIKLKKGKCPFLKKEKTGKYTCTIYENRPESCRLFIPFSKICDKKAEELIELISYIEIEEEKISVSVKNGLFYYYPLTEKLKKIYSEILAVVSGIDKDKLKWILDNLTGILDDLEKGEASMLEFRDYLERVKTLINDIKNDEKLYNPEIDEISTRVIELEKEGRDRDPKEEYIETSEAGLLKIQNFLLKEIIFYDFSLGLSYTINNTPYNYYIKYGENDNLLKEVRAFSTILTKVIREVFPLALEIPRNQCYTCGHCCSRFVVEIAPSDILRLAKEFNMTEKKFRKEYIESPRFGWNPGNGILKRYIDGSLKRCIFLKKDKKGHYLCSVHQVKPELCKVYRTGKPHCYREVTEEHYYRLLSNIQYIQLDSENLNITTNTDKAFPVNWKSYIALEQSVNNFINCLKNHLESKYFSEVKT